MADSRCDMQSMFVITPEIVKPEDDSNKKIAMLRPRQPFHKYTVQVYTSSVYKTFTGFDTYELGLVNPKDYVSIDCEMVGVNDPRVPNCEDTSALGRISIVNYGGEIMMDTFVKPSFDITSYRTQWSGLNAKMLMNAPKFDYVRQSAMHLLKGKVIIGHSVHADLDVLEYRHPRHMVVDTHVMPWLREKARQAGEKGNALRKWTLALVGQTIQSGSDGHCSIEDSKATMALFKLVEDDWRNWFSEKKIKNRPRCPMIITKSSCEVPIKTSVVSVESNENEKSPITEQIRDSTIENQEYVSEIKIPCEVTSKVLSEFELPVSKVPMIPLNEKTRQVKINNSDVIKTPFAIPEEKKYVMMLEKENIPVTIEIPPTGITIKSVNDEDIDNGQNSLHLEQSVLELPSTYQVPTSTLPEGERSIASQNINESFESYSRNNINESNIIQISEEIVNCPQQKILSSMTKNSNEPICENPEMTKPIEKLKTTFQGVNAFSFNKKPENISEMKNSFSLLKNTNVNIFESNIVKCKDIPKHKNKSRPFFNFDKLEYNNPFKNRTYSPFENNSFNSPSFTCNKTSNMNFQEVVNVNNKKRGYDNPYKLINKSHEKRNPLILSSNTNKSNLLAGSDIPKVNANNIINNKKIDDGNTIKVKPTASEKNKTSHFESLINSKEFVPAKTSLDDSASINNNMKIKDNQINPFAMPFSLPAKNNSPVINNIPIPISEPKMILKNPNNFDNNQKNVFPEYKFSKLSLIHDSNSKDVQKPKLSNKIESSNINNDNLNTNLNGNNEISKTEPIEMNSLFPLSNKPPKNSLIQDQKLNCKILQTGSNSKLIHTKNETANNLTNESFLNSPNMYTQPIKIYSVDKEKLKINKTDQMENINDNKSTFGNGIVLKGFILPNQDIKEIEVSMFDEIKQHAEPQKVKTKTLLEKEDLVVIRSMNKINIAPKKTIKSVDVNAIDINKQTSLPTNKQSTANKIDSKQDSTSLISNRSSVVNMGQNTVKVKSTNMNIKKENKDSDKCSKNNPIEPKVQSINNMNANDKSKAAKKKKINVPKVTHNLNEDIKRSKITITSEIKSNSKHVTNKLIKNTTANMKTSKIVSNEPTLPKNTCKVLDNSKLKQKESFITTEKKSTSKTFKDNSTIDRSESELTDNSSCNTQNIRISGRQKKSLKKQQKAEIQKRNKIMKHFPVNLIDIVMPPRPIPEDSSDTEIIPKLLDNIIHPLETTINKNSNDVESKKQKANVQNKKYIPLKKTTPQKYSGIEMTNIFSELKADSSEDNNTNEESHKSPKEKKKNKKGKKNKNQKTNNAQVMSMEIKNSGILNELSFINEQSKDNQINRTDYNEVTRRIEDNIDDKSIMVPPTMDTQSYISPYDIFSLEFPPLPRISDIRNCIAKEFKNGSMKETPIVKHPSVVLGKTSSGVVNFPVKQKKNKKKSSKKKNKKRR